MTMQSIACVTISYNQISYLPDCLNSVVPAKGMNLQHIIVDPGSSDGSREVIEAYIKRDIFRQAILSPDKGPSDGLNKGFHRVNSDLFCYINSDDRLTPGALEYVTDYFNKNKNVSVLCGGVAVINSGGKPRARRRLSRRFSLVDFLDGNFFIAQQATFFTRAAFERAGGFNAENKTCWDTELVIKMAIKREQFAFTDKILAEYRIYPGTITYNFMNLGYSDQFCIDYDKIRASVRNCGHKESRGIIRIAKRFFFKCNPFFRLREFIAR